MASAYVSESSGPGSNPGQEQDTTLTVPLSARVYKMGTGALNSRGGWG